MAQRMTQGVWTTAGRSASIRMGDDWVWRHVVVSGDGETVKILFFFFLIIFNQLYFSE